MYRAREEWNNITTAAEQLAWVKKYLFDIAWFDNLPGLNTMIGDKYYVQTHLFVLFYEVFLNAVKAISYAPKDQRKFLVRFSVKNDVVFVEMCNSVGKVPFLGGGQGNLMIRAYMDKFSVPDFDVATPKNDFTYKMSFSLPFISQGE